MSLYVYIIPEILNLSTQTWRDGPAPPLALGNDPYAQVGSTFVVTEVYASKGEMTVLMFDEVNYCWTVVRKMGTDRTNSFALIELPEELGACDGGIV